MAAWAAFRDGVEVDEGVFRMLARFAPAGTMDVFASDQHNSYLKLTTNFLAHVGEGRKATNEDVREVCRRFARALGGASTAALFNHLAFESPGFRELLGERIMLIGRLEDSFTESIDGGRGQLARLAREPEAIADRVDAFKTLVKLDPDHGESWERNLAWIEDLFARCARLGKPLYNETLMFQRPGESKADFARRLPEGLVRLAEAFGPHGHFYKTQVPLLWVEEDGEIETISGPAEVRRTAERMAGTVDRPMLLLSAAVDFEQYAAQYGIVADLFAGPMCGRAYFKEAFTDRATRDLESLEASFRRIALPRIAQIRKIAAVVSRPWWERFSWMAEEARALLRPGEKARIETVRADYGY